MSFKKGLLLAMAVLGVSLFLWFDMGRFLTLTALKANRQSLLDYYGAHRLLMVTGFMAIYIVQTALSLPGAAILSLAAGAIFGSVMGTLYANIAATIGATVAFLVTRYLFRDFILSKFGTKLEGINRELEERGFNYLLFLRLVPLFPFFLINLAAGLTRLPLRTFFLGTMIGIIPGGFVFVNAGASLASIDSLSGIASPRVLGSFALLGLFALLPVLYNKFKGLKLLLLSLFMLEAFLSPSVSHSEELPVSRFETEELAGWQVKSFKGATDYRLLKENDHFVVKAISNSSASGLVKKIRFNPSKFRYLRWSWKVAHSIKSGDEKSKAGDDYAARVYVIFPGRFFWQTKAINYIWANKLATGESAHNVYTSNARMLAVESGNEKAGQWLSEERDLLTDYRTLFGVDPQEAEAVAIMTDTDNTGGAAEAWYGEIILSTEGK